MAGRLSVLSFLFAIMTVASAAAAVLTVQPDGSGTHPTIAAAVQDAQSGDTIQLGDGTFTGDGNRDIPITGKSLYIRSVSGDPTTCVIDADGSEAWPRYIFEVTDSTGETVIIEGITLRGAWRPASRISLAGGAVVSDATTQLTISNCVFRDNHAAYGGAVGLAGGPHEITGCRFEMNQASPS